MNEIMRNKIANLPDKPGCYMYKNASGVIIYVGKAKNLKNRVRSYFHSKESLPPKTRIMISEAEQLEYFITDSETEAFMLETNLIKMHRPRYNILMKDDKSYPYIKLTTNEIYPRLILTRTRVNDGCRSFGPYLNSYAARKTIDAIHRFFPMKKCNKNIVFGKATGKVCLNCHIGLCPGLCRGDISREEYSLTVERVKTILSGNFSELRDLIKKAMNEAAEALNFESAIEYKELLGCVESLFEKQKINDVQFDERDIIGTYRDGEILCAIIFNVRDGKLSNTKTKFLTGGCEQGDDIEAFLAQYYLGGEYIPREIIIERLFEGLEGVKELLRKQRGAKVKIITAVRGDKKRLLDMAKRNARLAVETSKTRETRREEAGANALGEIEAVLALPGIPHRIEAYDISNISGSENVGVMIAFENAKKNTSALRKFRIKFTAGQDDYASTAEVVFRRLNRAKKELDENEPNPKFLPLPELIFADGGYAHVKVISSMIQNFGFPIVVAGLVKDNKHKLRAVVNSEGETIPLSEFIYSKNLLNAISEEVHNQAIGYHRASRSRKMVATALTEIPGIGEKRAISLLKTFGSVEAIGRVDFEELCRAPGMNKASAKAIIAWFEQKDNEKA